MRYLVVVEQGETSWGAHVPDIPGCIAVGESKREVLDLVKEAIDVHIEALKDSALPVPAPASAGDYVETNVA